jgi:hypothetical protein
MKRKLIAALAAYALLAALAAFTLDDAVVRIGSHTASLRDAVWIMLGGFALKTLIAYARFRSEEPTEGTTDPPDSPQLRP